MAAGQADSTPTPRAHPARRRTNPGSTPSDGGRNPDRHPQVADKPRTDRHATHPPPGDGRWQRGRPIAHRHHVPTPPEGGQTPDRHPQMADETRIDTLRWRTNPGPTATPRTHRQVTADGSGAGR